MSLRSDVSSYPLHIDDNAHLVLVNIQLEGKNQSRALLMALDTGASVTTIPFSAADAIGLDLENPESRIEMITASGNEEVPIVRVPKLWFFGFELENVEIGVADLPSESHVAGLVGLNILSQFDLFLGFKSKKLRIWK